MTSKQDEMQEWYTVQEAGNYLRVTSATLYNYMKDGRLQFYYLAGTKQRRLKKEDLVALLELGSPKELEENSEE